MNIFAPKELLCSASLRRRYCEHLPSEGGTVLAVWDLARLLVVIPAYLSSCMARSTTQEYGVPRGY